MRSTIFAMVLAGGLLAAPAEALTARDIIELTRAGLGEDVLLALIEVDGSRFAIDPATIRSLKAAGVSEKVIVALVRSGRDPAEQAVAAPAVEPAPEPEPAPQPQVVVIDHHDAEPRQVLVPVPVYVGVAPRAGRRTGHQAHPPVQSTFVPFQFGAPPPQPVVHQPKEPVYWGFGGKLRPDAWKPDGHKESRTDRK